MLRVPGMGLFIFCLVYVYIGNDIDLVESTPGVVFLFVWLVFYSELFLYFENHGFYMGTGVVFWCMELWCDEECKLIVCGFWVGLGGQYNLAYESGIYFLLFLIIVYWWIPNVLYKTGCF